MMDTDILIVENIRIHHIGYLVKNIERAKNEFIRLGYQMEKETVYDSFRNINISFLVKDGYRVELVSPMDGQSVVGELRKKMGNSPYHICYEVRNLTDSIDYLKHNKYVIWEEPHAAAAIDNRAAAFLVHSQLGMIELIEAVGNGYELSKYL